MSGGTPPPSLDVSRETSARLEAYANLLAKWNRRINLVAPNSLAQAWTRHFADSAQIERLAAPSVTRWADLGSGGGFPGLVVAVIALEIRPDLHVTCIESDQRKAAFLETVIRTLGLSADVIVNRAEDTPPLQADIVSARALAPLDHLIPLAARHLGSDAKALFLKGARWRDEVAQARRDWSFDMRAIPSKTDAKGVILEIGDIRRA